MSKAKAHGQWAPLWICGLAVLCVGATVPRAFAEQPDLKGASIKVRFGDLNLGNPDGVATLYRRIDSAARRVCNLETESWDPSRNRHWRYCVETAVANAVSDVHNQALTAMYREKNKQGVPG